MINDSRKLSIKTSLLNRSIFLFISNLLKSIFLKRNQKNISTLNNKLDEWIKVINEKIIKNQQKYINKYYSKQNLKNIILFVKTQNYKYNGDIIEVILIFIFSYAFQCEQDMVFCKFIFNNLNRIRDQNNPYFSNWILNSKFVPTELNSKSKGIEELLKADGKEEEFKPSEEMEECIFYNFLREILNHKFKVFINNNSRNKSYMKYINDGNFFGLNISESIYNKTKRIIEKTILDKDIINNSIYNQDIHYSSKISEKNKPNIQIIRSFFMQVYIYYQNKNSPLLKYQLPSNNPNLVSIPFSYDLCGACVEGRFSHICLSPIRICDFVEKLLLRQNNLRECGLLEIGKICVFNNNIKLIEMDTNLIRSNYLNYFTMAMGLFDNYSVEEINFSYNYLREEADEFLIKIVKHFKNLKVLNINSNELKRGLANFFIVLKDLYRHNKTKLEVLGLSKTNLDDSCFYELGELLKSQYCKLKIIYLNENPIPANCRIFKKLKKNKSLREIYLNKDNIGDEYVDDISRFMSNSNIKQVYLFKNKLHNFNGFLRILYRTKLIKKNHKKKNSSIIIKNENIALMNLDISNNEFPIKNKEQINLLNLIFNETSLLCLDMSHILYGSNPDKLKGENIEFKPVIDSIKSSFEKEKKAYSEGNRNLRKYQVNINKLKHIENEEFVKNYELDNNLEEILSNPNCIYTTYLFSKALEILKHKEEEVKNVINEENKTTMMKNIKDYFLLRVSEQKVKELERKRDKKKLILI